MHYVDLAVSDYIKFPRFHPHLSYNLNKVKVWETNLDLLAFRHRRNSLIRFPLLVKLINTQCSR
jgi:hypothetical protein